MAPSHEEQLFGATSNPEIAREHLKAVEADCGLRPEFAHGDVEANGLAFVAADAGSGRLTHALLEEIDLSDSKLRAVRLVDVEGDSLNASNGDWRGASLHRVLFSNCRLTGLNLSEAILDEVALRGCKVDYANFRFAKLSRVSFEDCVLTDADFQGAKCKLSRFSGCHMHGTDFSKVELDGVDLRGSELRLSGGVEALRGALISTPQAVDLAISLAEEAGITVAD